jgi:hypothetical protein
MPAPDEDLPAAQDDRFPSLPGRRRALIALLAVGTAVTIFWLLIYRPGGLHPRHPRTPLDDCAPGQIDHCVGGLSQVITLPPAVEPPASTPAPSGLR